MPSYENLISRRKGLSIALSISRLMPRKTIAASACVLLAAIIATAALLLHKGTSGSDQDLDWLLAKVIREYNLRPLQTRRFEADPKYVLGQALFFDPVLSGTRDVSCATCHQLRYGTGDGLRRSIGVLGVGIGPARRLTRGSSVHPRNALDLWNRDNNAVKALFWDGRVEVLDPVRKLYRSPLGTALPSGLQNALAVQALFPLVIPDEMLGEKSDRSPSYLPAGHRNLPNDLVSSESFKNETDRILDAHNRLILRLLGVNRPNEWQRAYRVLFADAYPAMRREDLSIVDLANAIAHFEEMAFATKSSAWDRYLAGQRSAITRAAKQGAILFYGKARCVACHAGPLFSDFEYHSVGIFGSRSGTSSEIDYGRWNVTYREKDRYRFRTPPLRNVTQTAPYFHDGSSSDLKQAVTRHLELLKNSDKYRDDGSFEMSLDQIESISPVLVPKITLSEKEIHSLISFLSSLDFEPHNVDMIVPKRVPSGLPIEYPTH